MSRIDRRAFRESVEPYLTTDQERGVTKLSISLPTDLVDLLRASAAETGSSVSATVAAAIRRAVADAEQERLQAAIVAQNEENLEFSRAYESVATGLFAKLEW